MTAAVLAAAAPITSALPNPLSVTASAETAKKYNPGNVFYYGGYGEIGDNWGFSDNKNSFDSYFECTVKSNGTLKISGWSFWDGIPRVEMFDTTFYKKSLTIPSQIGEYTVSEIGLPDDKSSPLAAQKVVIPETIETIGTNTFCNWFYLEEVEFAGNSKLKTIGKWAFWNCRSLKSITIPASVETIETCAFANNVAKDNEKYPLKGKWQRKIGEYEEFDFTNTFSLTSVKFAEGSKLKVIDQWAFQKQPKLKSIVLPNSLEKIAAYTFHRCENLTEINVPKNVNEIGVNAFNGATSEDGKTSALAKITVDKDNPNFKSVDGIVFSKDGKTIVSYPPAKSGDKYEIPSEVNQIAENAFTNAHNLTSITIPEGVTEILDDTFWGCSSLKKIKLPSTLKTIGARAFGKTAFTDLTVPESVTAIDAHAFDSAALKTIYGKAGSYAETFAKENGYAFKEGTAPESDDTDTTNTFTDPNGAADVQVIANPNAIPKEAVFSVKYDDANSNDSRVAYNLSFTYNGADYEPTETVTVKIPVPITMRDIADTLKVYHLQDGKFVSMNAKVEDGWLVFDTDHFSTYVVTAEELETVAPGGSESTSGSGSTGNPNTGVALAIAPVLLAGAAVVVLKKRK